MSGELDRCQAVNDVVGSLNSCTNQLEYDFYNYNVTVWQAALFLTLFSILTVAHTIQGVLSRKYWLLPTFALCAGLEVLGWAARLASATGAEWIAVNGGHWYSPRTPFLIQISVLIFAPAFLAAGYYILLGRLIKRVGPQYCRFNPTTYAIVFCTGDFISLVIQGIGGGLASAAETLEDANNGAYIMVGGVISQMFFMVLYCLVLAEWTFRYFTKKPVQQFRFRRSDRQRAHAVVPYDTVSPAAQKKVKILIIALITSTVFLFIRSIYRCIELLEGWNGKIISDEGLFSVLDGLMVFLAVLVFNVIHPLWCWPKQNEVGESYMEKVNSEPLSVA